LENKENQMLEEREEISNIGILDVVDLSVLLRVNVQTARRYINDKKIPAYRVANGKYLISVESLKKHIEENII